MSYRRFLGACCHLEGSQKDGDESGELLNIFLFTLYHPENNTVTLAHTLGMV